MNLQNYLKSLGQHSYTRLSPLIILVMVLVALGLGMSWLKHQQFRIPLTPGGESEVWLVEAHLEFKGKGRPAKVTLDLPAESPAMQFMDESYISRAYGLAVLREPRQATWTRRRAPTQQQSLYYRVEVHPGAGAESIHGRSGSAVPDFPLIPDYQEPLGSAIAITLEQARQRSADVHSFAAQLMLILADPLNPNSKVIRNSTDKSNWPSLVTEILAGARIPARVIYGLSLDKAFTNRQLTPWIEVHNGRRWQGYNSETGDMGYPKNFFVWSYEKPGPYTSFGIRDAQLNFSATSRAIEQASLVSHYHKMNQATWSGLSLESLPLSTRNLYQILLMLPIGALVVAMMRVVIGVPTFGTFMPILIALAFRETQLLEGITLFLLIVFIGFVLRIALANLRLLLVPRLAGMLVIIVLLMLSITLLSARLGFDQGLSIALFPMVIMTLTVERMSIVWDERGLKEMMIETLGSLLVAVVGYYCMNSEGLIHLFMNFPELLLVVLAACLSLGAYNGYRLTELVRFRDLLTVIRR